MPTPTSLCILPWIHAHIQIDGTTKLCCVSGPADNDNGRPPSIHERPVGDLFNSPYMQKTRQEMLNGVWPTACSTCQSNESLGVPSFRQHYNQKYPVYFKQLQERPQSFEPNIRSVDLRISNLCNFKCRMCGGMLSSRWSEDHEAMYPTFSIPSGIQGLHQADEFWADFYENLLPNLEEIHFAGGEPLVTEEHYLILERLIAAGKTDVGLYYDTNLSRLTFKRWDIVELWKQFKHVRLSLSLDGVGRIGEYIRHGLDYEQWRLNLGRVKAEVPHVQRVMHMVVSVFDVFQLREHYREIIDNGYVTPDNLGYTYLQWPEYLNVQVLHPLLKLEARQRLQRMLEEEGLLNEKQRSFVSGLIAYLFQQNLYVRFAGEFANKTAILDERRDENILQLVPELAIMMQTVA